MTRSPGFSLVELVVTLVVAAILAALVLPRLTHTESDAAWFHEEVKAAIRFAQRQAVAQRRAVFVQVTAGQVALCYDAGCGAHLVSFAASAGDQYIVNAPAGVTLTPVTFSFNGLGQPAPATTIDISGRIITVTAETGYVR